MILVPMRSWLSYLMLSRLLYQWLNPPFFDEVFFHYFVFGSHGPGGSPWEYRQWEVPSSFCVNNGEVDKTMLGPCRLVVKSSRCGLCWRNPWSRRLESAQGHILFFTPAMEVKISNLKYSVAWFHRGSRDSPSRRFNSYEWSFTWWWSVIARYLGVPPTWTRSTGHSSRLRGTSAYKWHIWRLFPPSINKRRWGVLGPFRLEDSLSIGSVATTLFPRLESIIYRVWLTKTSMWLPV